MPASAFCSAVRALQMPWVMTYECGSCQQSCQRCARPRACHRRRGQTTRTGLSVSDRSRWRALAPVRALTERRPEVNGPSRSRRGLALGLSRSRLGSCRSRRHTGRRGTNDNNDEARRSGGEKRTTRPRIAYEDTGKGRPEEVRSVGSGGGAKPRVAATSRLNARIDKPGGEGGHMSAICRR